MVKKPKISLHQTKFDQFFIELAAFIAQRKSKDGSTKVGAVIVGIDQKPLSFGWNGFPRGVDDTKILRHKRPAKYRFTEHAERNAIYNAQCSLKGATLYTNYEPIPCTDCTRAIIQSGITTIVGPPFPFPGKGLHWTDDFRASVEMLREARIETRTVSLSPTPSDVMGILYPGGVEKSEETDDNVVPFSPIKER